MHYDIKTNKFCIKYYINKVLHREEGPAVEYFDGGKEWWVNDKLHREDGPAVEYASGEKLWYKNGLQHREDGPAVEYANGKKFWYLNNKCYGSNDKFNNKTWKKFIKTLIFY